MTLAEAFDLRGIIASMTTLTSIGIQNTLQTKAAGRRFVVQGRTVLKTQMMQTGWLGSVLRGASDLQDLVLLENRKMMVWGFP